MGTDYASYSNKRPSTLQRATTFGVTEALETGSMSLMSAEKRKLIEAISPSDDGSIMNEMAQDGVASAIGILQGAVMQKQEQFLEATFEKTFAIASALVAKSKMAGFFKNKFPKGRKLSLLSKFIGDNNKDVEIARLVAQMGTMDTHASASSHNPASRFARNSCKIEFEAHEVNKERNRLQMANMQLDGLTRAFQWKLEVGGFTKADKPMIRDVLGVASITDDYIDKLNSINKSKVFKDSNGDYVGHAQVNASLMNALGYHRAT